MTTLPAFEIDGVAVPAFLYGTAWKEDATENLVSDALKAGFRGIDTANQRKHYHEAGVGAALKTAFEAGDVKREDLFLQTKFTFQAGQDHRLPYDPAAPFAEQVAQSYALSLEHLGVDRLDSYVLHGPQSRPGLTAGDRETWGAIEQLKRTGKTRLIGVSNVSAGQLSALIEGAELAPQMVQNRCYARMGWDREVRAICQANDIVYQGFSLLTANRAELASAGVLDLAQKHQRTVPQTVFRFCHQQGMVCLTGTTRSEHMSQDLHIADFELSAPEMLMLERLSG